MKKAHQIGHANNVLKPVIVFVIFGLLIGSVHAEVKPPKNNYDRERFCYQYEGLKDRLEQYETVLKLYLKPDQKDWIFASMNRRKKKGSKNELEPINETLDRASSRVTENGYFRTKYKDSKGKKKTKDIDFKMTFTDTTEGEEAVYVLIERNAYWDIQTEKGLRRKPFIEKMIKKDLEHENVREKIKQKILFDKDWLKDNAEQIKVWCTDREGKAVEKKGKLFGHDKD